MHNLVDYFGINNSVIILEDAQQLKRLKELFSPNLPQYEIIAWLSSYPDLHYRTSTNIKNALRLFFSLLRILCLHIRYGWIDVTICAIEPERYLYMLWLPFIRVTYILHSEPLALLSGGTPITCNRRLGKNKKIITVSNYMKQALCACWHIRLTSQSFVHIVYNYASERAAPLSLPNELPGSKMLVTTLGHVHQRKNPFLWLQVAQAVTDSLPGIQFVWLGNGELLEHFQQLTSANPRITFLGLQQNTQGYLQKSAIYYQPSLIEPQGIAVLEAMYMGLGCIVSDAGGLPESVEDGYNGLVVPTDQFQDHVIAILKLINDEELLQLYGQRSRARYQQYFSREVFMNKMNALYH